MVCQECKICEKEDGSLCLYTQRDCYDGCTFCMENDYCKYEGK